MTIPVSVLTLVAALTIALFLGILSFSFWRVQRKDRTPLWLTAWLGASAVFVLCRLLQYAPLREQMYIVVPRILVAASYSLAWFGYELANAFIGYRPPRWERALFMLLVAAPIMLLWTSNLILTDQIVIRTFMFGEEFHGVKTGLLYLPVSLLILTLGAFLVVRLLRAQDPHRRENLLMAAGLLFVILFSLNDFFTTSLNLAWIRLSDYSYLPVAIFFSFIQVQRFGRLYRDMDVMVHERTAELRQANEALRAEITERKRAEERLAKVNECLLSFGADPSANISRLTALCGELLGADCALYNRLDQGMLCSWGQWKTPPDYNPVDKPDGHICYDVIKHGSDELLVVRNLSTTQYAQTDPNVTQYKLQTYIGQAVKFVDSYVGSLCMVYQHDFIPSEDDKRLVKAIAVAIGVEEERKRAEQVRTALYRISESAQTAEDLDELYRLLHSIIGELMPAKNFYIALYDPSADSVHFPYYVDEFDTPPPPQKLGKGLTEYVLRMGNPLLATPEVFEQLVQSGQVELAGALSVDWLGTPLTLRAQRGEIIGVMATQTYTEATRLDEADKDVLVFVSTQVAMAIERKRAEEALRESEERFRNLFEGIPTCCWTFDRQGTILDWNHASEELYGWTAEQALGKTMYELMVREENVAATQEKIAAVFAGQSFRGLEYMDRRADGTTCYVLVNEYPVWNSQGQVIMGICAGLDITERKWAEEALRESEDKYRSLVERANDGITIIQSGKVRYANLRLAQLWGGSVEEIMGTPFTDYIHPAELSRIADRYRRRMAGEDVTPMYETRLLRKDGSEVFVELNAGSITYQGAPADLVIVRDITERKQAEKALQESEEKYRTLVQNVPIGVYRNTPGPQGKFLMANPAFFRIFGFGSWEELRKAAVADLYVDPGERKLFSDRLLAQGKVTGVELHLKRKDGTRLWGSVTARVIYDERGQVAYFDCALEDITERKQAEEQIRKLNRTLTAINEVNQALVRAADEAELLQRVCQIIVEVGGHRLAWVGWAEQDERKTVRPVASAGHDEGYLDAANITWADTERGRGPTGGAIRTGQPAICRDILTDPLYAPWREQALQRGYASSIALPLLSSGQAFGALHIYAAEPDAFGAEEVTLLTGLASDLAYGLSALRTQAETQQRAKRLAILNHIARALSATLNLDELLELVYRETMTVIQADAFFIALYDHAANELDFRIRVDKGIRELAERRRLGPTLTSSIITSKQPRLIRDFEQEKEHLPPMKLWGTEQAPASWLGVPMLLGANVVGVISVQAYRPNVYGPAEQELLSTIADTVAVAIENARLFEAERQQRELAETLCEVGATLAATLDVNAVLDRLLEQVSRAVPNDAANVMLIEADQAYVARWRGYERFGAADYIAAAAFPVATGIPILRRTIETGEPVVIPDTFADPNWIHYPETEWLRSFAAAPIRVRGEVIGFLNVDSATPGFFGPQHAERLRAFADQAAIAIENARLYEAAQDRARHLATLNEIGQAVTSTLDLDSVLIALLEHVRHVTDAEACSVALTDSETGDLIFRQAVGEAAQAVIGLRLKPNQGIAGWVATHRQSALVPDAASDSRFYGNVDKGTGFVTRDAACVPLIMHDAVIGVIELLNKRNGGFDEDNVQLLQAVATQAAIAIENARLYTTEQQRAAALARALEQQRELDRLQREFIQNVSHELRTPLSLIRGHAEVLESGWMGELSPEQRESIGVIVHRSQMLTKMVNDIISVLEVEQRELVCEPVDLGPLARACLAEFRATAEKADLVLSAEIVSELPPVSGDAIALRCLLDNLVSNACKFTPAGGRVTMRLYPSANTLKLEVADTGIGISADQLEHIFERFYQVDGSATRRYGGMGLGLALVKQIVEAHGGQITAASEIGVGTTFTVWLPKA